MHRGCKKFEKKFQKSLTSFSDRFLNFTRPAPILKGINGTSPKTSQEASRNLKNRRQKVEITILVPGDHFTETLQNVEKDASGIDAKSHH